MKELEKSYNTVVTLLYTTGSYNIKLMLGILLFLIQKYSQKNI